MTRCIALCFTLCAFTAPLAGCDAKKDEESGGTAALPPAVAEYRDRYTGAYAIEGDCSGAVPVWTLQKDGVIIDGVSCGVASVAPAAPGLRVQTENCTSGGESLPGGFTYVFTKFDAENMHVKAEGVNDMLSPCAGEG